VPAYFFKGGPVEDPRTYSMRGLPQPHEDKYFSSLFYFGPVYGLWAGCIPGFIFLLV